MGRFLSSALLLAMPVILVLSSNAAAAVSQVYPDSPMPIAASLATTAINDSTGFAYVEAPEVAQNRFGIVEGDSASAVGLEDGVAHPAASLRYAYDSSEILVAPNTTTVYLGERPGNARLDISSAGDVAIKGDNALFLSFGDEARGFGDTVTSAVGLEYAVVGLVEGSTRQAAAFNLSVDGLHTFFVVTDTGVPLLVHNSNDGPCGGDAPSSVPNPSPQLLPDGTADRGPAGWVNTVDDQGNLTTHASTGKPDFNHAEINAQTASPGSPMSEVWGWRGPTSDPNWEQIPICPQCQAALDPSLFPNQPDYVPGGPWDYTPGGPWGQR